MLKYGVLTAIEEVFVLGLVVPSIPLMFFAILAALDDKHALVVLILVVVLSIHLVIKGSFRFVYNQFSKLLTLIINESQPEIINLLNTP